MQSQLKAFFLSDIHLSSPDEERTQVLLKFLRKFNAVEDGTGARDITHLFLMGDIFDLWIGHHRYFCEKWVEVVGEIFRLHQRGVEVHYFEGNHDLYLQLYFGNQLGFRVHGEPIVISVGPWQVRLEHGDQMDPEDRGYRFLRWLLRTPILRWIAKSRLTEKFVVRLGEGMSHASRDYTSNRKTITEAVARGKIRAHALKVYGKTPYDFLIAGHVHVKDDYAVEVSQVVNGGQLPVAINLGSWLTEPIAYCLTEKGGEFVSL
jgi:UDP-2,3-diacylglucosamine hydrolase